MLKIASANQNIEICTAKGLFLFQDSYNYKSRVPRKPKRNCPTKTLKIDTTVYGNGWCIICIKYRRFPKFFLGRSVIRLGDCTGFFTRPDHFSVAIGNWTSASHYPCHRFITRHNLANSVTSSNHVCIKEVAIRITFSHMINIAGIIYCTLSLPTDIHCSTDNCPHRRCYFSCGRLWVQRQSRQK